MANIRTLSWRCQVCDTTIKASGFRRAEIKREMAELIARHLVENHNSKRGN